MRLRFKLMMLMGAGSLLLNLCPPVCALDLLLKAPTDKRSAMTGVQQEAETSCVKLAFAAAIRFYQTRISPVGGPDRCGFSPSCSTYGRQAVAEQGPLVGIMMIGDRLTRCNIWKAPGPDYTLLPNGKLYDPPAKNVLHAPP